MCSTARLVSLLARASVVAALCAAILALAGPGLAEAAPGSSFTVAPAPGQSTATRGYFILSLTPGQSSTQHLLVRNDAAKAIVVELAPIDAGTTPVGGVSYELAGQPLTQTGAWLSLSASRVPLVPGAVRQVDLTVTVPGDAQPGDYVAGISAMIPVKKAAASSSASNKASVQVSLQTRRVIAVQVGVPGAAVPKLTISGVEAVPMPSGMELAIAISSPGGTFTSGNGSVNVASTGFTRSFALGLFVPGTSIAYPIPNWQTAPKAGAYPTSVVIHYGNQDALTAVWNGDVTVASSSLKTLKNKYVAPPGTVAAKRPWLTYGLVGGLVLVILVMGFALLRRRRPDATS